VDVCDYLLEKNADPSIPNDKQQYPLHFSAFYEHEPIVHRLVEAKAPLFSKDRKGRIPSMDTKNLKIKDFLMAHERRGQNRVAVASAVCGAVILGAGMLYNRLYPKSRKVSVKARG